MQRLILITLLIPTGITFPQYTSAQCTTTFTSLEARIGSAKRVFHGTISGYERTVIVPRNGQRPGTATTIPDGVVQYKLTINVKEFLKGPKTKSVHLIVETSDYDQRHQQWKDLESEFLFFVNHVPQANGTQPLDNKWPSAWTLLRLGEPAPAEKGYSSVTLPIFAADFSVLTTREQVLARARQFAAKHLKTLKTYTFTIPHVIAAQCSAPCDANFLVVPIEPTLEQIAKRILSQPESFLPDKWRKDKLALFLLKCEAVPPLAHFRTEENETLLRSLLQDPTTHIVTVGQTEHREYPIRKAAWSILRKWGVDVKKPVIKESIK